MKNEKVIHNTTKKATKYTKKSKKLLIQDDGEYLDIVYVRLPAQTQMKYLLSIIKSNKKYSGWQQ